MSVKRGCEEVRRGEVITVGYGPVKAMAVADHYVMCRRPGMAPFVMSVKEWVERRKQQPEPAPSEG